jgi:predicted aspartyl protease
VECSFLLGLLAFCSEASSNPDRVILPPDASLIKGSEEGPVVVTLRLKNGKQFPAMVDTGTFDTTLDKSLNPELGKSLGTQKIHYAGGQKASAGVYEAELYLGDVQLVTGRRVLTSARGGMAILGMDCLRHYCFQVDFADGKIHFLDPDHVRTEELGQPFSISISPLTGNVIVRENFMSLKVVNWVVDTGGCGVDGLLNPKLFKQALAQQGVSAMPMGVNGKQTRGAIFHEGAFGGEPYSNLVFGEVRRDIWPKAPNVLGLRFLARHLVTFNFPKRLMYLRRRSVEDKADEGIH